MGLFLDFFDRPDAALRQVWARRPVGLGLLAYGVGASGFLASQAVFRRAPSLEWLPWWLTLGWGWFVLTGLFSACVMHFAAEAAGGRASAPGLFILVGLSELVWALAVPAALLLRAAHAGFGLFFPVSLALGFLTLAFKARSVRDHYGIPGWKAAGVAVLPYLVFILLGGWAFLFGLLQFLSLSFG